MATFGHEGGHGFNDDQRDSHPEPFTFITMDMKTPTIDNQLYIVNLSFGLGSFCAAKRIIDEVGVENVLCIFADTKYEDEDTYAWGEAASKALGCELVRLCDGRDPWQVFKDERYLGNDRVDPCSKILKRELIDRYLKATYDPNTVVLIFGIHWSEADRFDRLDPKTGKRMGIKPRMEANGWTCRAPLCEPPFISLTDMEKMAADAGLWKQRLYAMGFPHANCGGRCVKQGQSGWALLYRTMPERFIECRDKEKGMQEYLGKDVTMLRETVKGQRLPLPLAELQRRIDAKEEMPLFDFGGCACFAGDD